MINKIAIFAFVVVSIYAGASYVVHQMTERRVEELLREAGFRDTNAGGFLAEHTNIDLVLDGMTNRFETGQFVDSNDLLIYSGFWPFKQRILIHFKSSDPRVRTPLKPGPTEKAEGPEWLSATID